MSDIDNLVSRGVDRATGLHWIVTLDESGEHYIAGVYAGDPDVVGWGGESAPIEDDRFGTEAEAVAWCLRVCGPVVRKVSP